MIDALENWRTDHALDFAWFLQLLIQPLDPCISQFLCAALAASHKQAKDSVGGLALTLAECHIPDCK